MPGGGRGLEGDIREPRSYHEYVDDLRRSSPRPAARAVVRAARGAAPRNRRSIRVSADGAGEVGNLARLRGTMSQPLLKRRAVLQSVRALVVVSGLLAAGSAAALEPPPARLDYQVEEGLNSNHFLRQGEVAAHLVLRSGTDPRI